MLNIPFSALEKKKKKKSLLALNRRMKEMISFSLEVFVRKDSGDEREGRKGGEKVEGADGGSPVCLCFQSTVESPGGQQCLRGFTVTTHSRLPPPSSSLILLFSEFPETGILSVTNQLNKKPSPLLSYPSLSYAPARRPRLRRKRSPPCQPLVDPSLTPAG